MAQTSLGIVVYPRLVLNLWSPAVSLEFWNRSIWCIILLWHDSQDGTSNVTLFNCLMDNRGCEILWTLNADRREQAHPLYWRVAHSVTNYMETDLFPYPLSCKRIETKKTYFKSEWRHSSYLRLCYIALGKSLCLAGGSNWGHCLDFYLY